MKLANALPDLFKKKVPKLKETATVLEAIELVRKSDDGVVVLETPRPKGSEDVTKHFMAVSGYSIVSGLVQTTPENYGRFLKELCIRCALPLGTVSFEDDIESLLHVYETSTFGFALVEATHERKFQEIVVVRDLLTLYSKQIFSSTIHVHDAASAPVFGMPQSTSLRDALFEMVKRKFRRLEIPGTNEIVSSGQILDHVFDESRLKKIETSPEHLLDGILGQIVRTRVPWVDEDTSVGDTARLLLRENQDCALSKRGIITPWDLIIKPWRLGELKISR